MNPSVLIHAENTFPSNRAFRANTTILLVDDDPSVLEVLRALLMFEGYNVIAAGSPKTALSIAAECSFDIVITDFQMPDLDGVTLGTLLTNSRRTLPVILMSGSQLSDIPMAEVTRHEWSFLAKPIDRERLLRIVDGECLIQARPSVIPYSGVSDQTDPSKAFSVHTAPPN